jgi:hypothetical protein
MSTRGVIARKTGSGFRGVYHHWDSYPSGLGKMLFELRNKKFKGDTQKMLKFLIDEHPNGWSTISNLVDKGRIGKDDYYEKGNESPAVTEKNASGNGVEYAYVFAGDTMEIWSSYTDIGGTKGQYDQKMIGFFGRGDDKAKWKAIAKVNLNGAEPDWKKIEGE